MTAGAASPGADWEVLVIGEALIDIVDDGTSATAHVGGSPANVALGLGRRGVSVALLTQIAHDARGRDVLEHLALSGVHVLPESFSADDTSVATAVIHPDGHAEYAFDVQWKRFESPTDTARVIHTGSIAAFLEPGATAVREALARSDAEEVTFDPNIRPDLVGDHAHAVETFELIARLSTVVKLSDEDASWLYPGLTIRSVIDTVLLLGPRLVVMTLGADGAIVAGSTDRVRIPAVRIDPVDTIGAGDTFMASLIHSILDRGSAGLQRDELEAIGRAATRAAAVTVSRVGANLPWASELDLR